MRAAAFDEALRRELSEERIHVMTVYPVATDTPMMETARSDSGNSADYDSPQAVAEALAAGLEAGDIAVVRGGDDFAALVAANHDDPRQADKQIDTMKAGLEARAARHRSM